MSVCPADEQVQRFPQRLRFKAASETLHVLEQKAVASMLLFLPTILLHFQFVSSCQVQSTFFSATVGSKETQPPVVST